MLTRHWSQAEKHLWWANRETMRATLEGGKEELGSRCPRCPDVWSGTWYGALHWMPGSIDTNQTGLTRPIRCQLVLVDGHLGVAGSMFPVDQPGFRSPPPGPRPPAPANAFFLSKAPKYLGKYLGLSSRASASIPTWKGPVHMVWWSTEAWSRGLKGLLKLASGHLHVGIWSWP